MTMLYSPQSTCNSRLYLISHEHLDKSYCSKHCRHRSDCSYEQSDQGLQCLPTFGNIKTPKMPKFEDRSPIKKSLRRLNIYRTHMELSLIVMESFIAIN